MPEASVTPMPDRPRVLSDFEGRWQLTRQILHGDGTRAQFSGSAVWMPEGDGMRYEETGVLRIGQGVGMTASRRYLWTRDLAVLFEDRRFFHQVPPKGGGTTHWCAPDRYDVVYDFTSWPEFHVTWQVSGPGKSYRMESFYFPARDL